MSEKPRKITQAELIGTELGMHINKVNAQFKQYENWLTITQNIILALARACKIKPEVLADMMAGEQGNKRFEEDVLNAYDKLVYKYSSHKLGMDQMKKELGK